MRKFDPYTAVFISVLVLIAITGIDVLFHDNFVLSSYQCDDPKNADLEICKKLTEKTTIQASILNTDFKYEFNGRQTYWIVLNLILIALSFTPAFFRSLLGSIKAGALYLTTALLPTLGGFEDYLYFASRGIPIPAEMPWLNENVFISLFAGGQAVTPTTLYTSMVAVVVILAIGWALALRRK